MAAVVYLLFIMTSLLIIEAHRTIRKLPKESARRDGLGVKASRSPRCIPGEFYNGHNCKQCFCNDAKVKVCTAPLTCKMDEPLPSRSDLIHLFNPALMSDLPTADNAAIQCKPGKSYRMDCNKCICTKTKSLMCQNLLCPSFDDVNRIMAKAMSGGSCQTGDTNSVNCVHCECKNGTLDCDFKKDCEPLTLLKSRPGYGKRKKCISGKKYENHVDNARPSCICTVSGKLLCSTDIQPRRPIPFDPAFLDPKSGKKCSPGVIYKNGCNRCTCTKNNILHCTTMTCLSSSGIMTQLKKRKSDTIKRRKRILSSSRKYSRGFTQADDKQNRNRTRMPFDEVFLTGKKCEPGVMYQKVCNKCSCNKDGAILCTTMACPSKKDTETFMKLHQKFDKEYE